MPHKYLFLVDLFAVLVMTIGCGSKPVRFTVADNGKTVEVNAGAQIIVELDGNPSTGYTWMPIDLDASMFKQVGNPEFKTSNPGLIGSGGSLTLTFKALKAGTGKLTLVYRRPWEKNINPHEIFTILVVVK